MHRFTEYSFFLLAPECKFNLNKYPGKFFLSWTLSPVWKDTDPVVGPATSDHPTRFDQEVSLVTKLIYNKQENQYHKKKSILHILYRVNDKPSTRMTKFGTVPINLQQFIEGAEVQGGSYQLENCHDKTARMQITIRVVKESDVSSPTRSKASIDMEHKSAKNIPDKNSNEGENFTVRDQQSEMKTAVKASKRSPTDRSRTVEKPSRNLVIDTNFQNEMKSDQNAVGILSQFRSEKQMRQGLSKELNHQREHNSLMTQKIIQLQDIIRETTSEMIDQTIAELQRDLAHSRNNLQTSTENLKHANSQISKLEGRVDVLQLENKQLLSQIETANKISKKVRFNLQEQTKLQDVKEQLDKTKKTLEGLTQQLAMQIHNSGSYKLQNQCLLEQIDSLSKELQIQTKQAGHYRTKYESYKLIKDKKRKDKQKMYKQEIKQLSEEILRLHEQLYKLRSMEKSRSREQLQEQNKQFLKVCTQKKEYESMRDTLSLLTNCKQDQQLLRLVTTRSRTMKDKLQGSHMAEEKVKEILLLLSQLKSLNVRMTSPNEKKLSLLVRQIEDKLEQITQPTIST